MMVLHENGGQNTYIKEQRLIDMVKLPAIMGHQKELL